MSSWAASLGALRSGWRVFVDLVGFVVVVLLPADGADLRFGGMLVKMMYASFVRRL